MTLVKERLVIEQNGVSRVIHTSRLANASGPLPAVLVIQEIWGVDGHILDVTDRFAKAGYLAVAPDLYAENGERPRELTDEQVQETRRFLRSGKANLFADADAREAALAALPDAERSSMKPAVDNLLGASRRIPEFVETLRAAFRFLEDFDGCRGQRIAAVGFCLGGALAAMLAAVEPALAGAVVYYGRLNPDSAAGISSPILGFFGGSDPGVTGLVPAFAEAMTAEGKPFDYQIFEAAPHAFFNDTNPAYHAAASRSAWSQTLSFLSRVTATN
jgi:carboxymethylenebutenolidase